MNFPVSLVLIFIALSFFYYTMQKTRIRREEKRERMREAREEFLNSLLKSKKQAEESTTAERTDHASQSPGEGQGTPKAE